MATDASPKKSAGDVYVCLSGTCRAEGGDAVLAEIEELASTVGGCAVRGTGCLGYCAQAPNAAVWCTATDTMIVEAEVRSIEASAKVVKLATGKSPRLDVVAMKNRCTESRLAQARKQARDRLHWNAALKGLEAQISEAERWALSNPDELDSLRREFRQGLDAAGFSGESQTGVMPTAVDSYTRWVLESVAPVSQHSAVFSFRSNDLGRGSPHPRGCGLKPELQTWHTTLLAEVGPNIEGPLPWIEREYTPISSAKEWESGRCRILIKIYLDGDATSWLYSVRPAEVWLSSPVKTLAVPSLVAQGSSFSPASVLLVLGGTGVVTLPQILHHRDPINQLGIATEREDQVCVPIDLVLSCRENDVPLLSQISEWCKEGEVSGVRQCTLLLTAAQTEPPIFPDVDIGNSHTAMKMLGDLANVNILHGRISQSILADASASMPQPCRAVVSGPEGFNRTVQQLLLKVMDKDAVTVLSAHRTRHSDGFGKASECFDPLAFF